MKKDNILYKHVYDSLVTQIYRGCYSCGEYLPSFEQLCGEFGVSNITIRKAVHLLVESHYVRITKSKRFQVIFDILNPEYEKGYLVQLASRKRAVLDTFDMLARIMPALFTEGAMLYGQEDLDELSRIVESINPWTQSLAEISVSASAFMMCVLSRLRNPVLQDLLKAANQFIMVSYLPGFDQPYPFAEAYMGLRIHFRQVAEMIQQKNRRELEESVRRFYAYGREKMRLYMDALTEGLKEPDEAEFLWNINGANPHFSLDLANTLMEQIEDGAYPAGNYLPSPSVLASRFSIGEATVRKTIAVLNRMSIVETVNGKGTRVCQPEECTEGDEPDALIRRIMGLGVYSAQILLVVSVELVQALDAPEECTAQLGVEPLKGSVRHLIGWIVGRISNVTLQACCRQMGLAVLFAYRIGCLEADAGRARALDGRCGQVCRCLEENGRARFEEELQRLLLDVYHFLREKSIQWELAEEQELILPQMGIHV